MARIQLSSLGAGIAQNPSGATIGGATGTIFLHGTLTPVPVFTSEIGGIANNTGNFVCDAYGRIQGWIDLNQNVDITIPPAPTVASSFLAGSQGPQGVQGVQGFSGPNMIATASDFPATTDSRYVHQDGTGAPASMVSVNTIYGLPWVAGTPTYRVNDIVTYGGSTYICTVAHTAGTTFDPTKFTAIALAAGVSNGVATLDANSLVPLAELPLIASTRGILTAIRELTSPLAANASAQSAPYDSQDPTTVGVDGIATFDAMITCDQAATLLVQSSADGVTWVTEQSVATTTVGTKQVARSHLIPSQRYVQAVETNGVTLQTSNLFVTTMTSLAMA